MIAIDTNVLARLLLRDNALQTDMADTLLATETLFVADGVFMEAEWVLRSAGWDRGQIAEAFAAISAHRNIVVEDTRLTCWALARHADGADMADMLHLVAGSRATEFVTFDQKLRRHAGIDPPISIRTLG